MRQFALGLLAVSVGSLMGLARVLISGKLILISCNALMLGGMIAPVQGLRRFSGFAPLSRAALGTLVLVLSLPFYCWMLIHHNFGMRVGVVSMAS